MRSRHSCSEKKPGMSTQNPASADSGDTEDAAQEISAASIVMGFRLIIWLFDQFIATLSATPADCNDNLVE
jgi:hypothetical protein